MAEEQHYDQSSAPTFCANSCGFFGNPTTLNLCSKCYRDHLLKETQRQEMDSLLSSTASAVSASSSLSCAVASVDVQNAVGSVSVGSATAVPETPSSGPSRCGACRKRVGLTGFRCRCGITYCGTHRYPELHSCTVDYQALGKEAIQKANPVIKAAKLHKI